MRQLGARADAARTHLAGEAGHVAFGGEIGSWGEQGERELAHGHNLDEEVSDAAVDHLAVGRDGCGESDG